MDPARSHRQSHFDRSGAEFRSEGIHYPLLSDLCESTRWNYEKLEVPDCQLSQLALNDCIGELNHKYQRARGTACSAVCKHQQIVRAALDDGEQWKRKSTGALLRRQSAGGSGRAHEAFVDNWQC
jgi:hypothetical protein